MVKKINKKKFQVNILFRSWTPVIIWALLIFASSSRQTTTTSEIYLEDFIIKKTAHVVIYAILATLLYRGFLTSGYSKRKAAKYAIIISVVYGFTDEFHQSFTPGRTPMLRDVVFDTIGAALAIYLIWNWLPKAPKKLKALAIKLQIL